jgi:GT2 family glycosyltransferase
VPPDGQEESPAEGEPEGQSDGVEHPFGPPSGQVEAVAPPVVVAMVAHDPGPWFEEALRSVVAQTYRNTSLLVIDGASAEEVSPRVAAIAPDAHVRRLDADLGFGPAANEVLGAVEGADFYLFCHDDIRLEPDAIQVMVEEAFRSNAGIVGGKLVAWDDSEQLLQVGMGADKTGAPAPYVDRGELDQEQHDAVRDVFYVPGAATLVRADLFSALGGFDPEIELLGEDLDLSWRAHVVGARVLVAPAARIAHLEALGHRRPVDDRRRLQMRHRLRTSRVCYTAPSRARVLPQAAAIAMVELIYGVVTGRFRHAADVISAWTWNLRRRRSTRQLRRELARHRRVPDSDVRSLQVHGSARWSAFVRGQRGAGQHRLGTVTASGREMVTNLRSARARASIVAWCAVLVVLLLGSRDLFTNGIPTIGQLAAFPGHPSQLVQQWTSGFRSTGLGSDTPAPTLLGVLGGLGYLFFGAMGLLRTILILGALPLGVVGIWRLARPLGSRRARITALVVYTCLPLAINALARGRWDGLTLYGFMPWILNQLARASGVAPYGPGGGEAGPGVVERPVTQRVLMLGLVTALAGLVAPVSVAVMVATALALVIGGLLVGEVRGALRLMGVALAGAAVAVVLQLPWSLSVASEGWRGIVGLSTTGSEPLSIGALLRFATGPFGSTPLGWVFLPAGLLVLLIGKSWRLRWAARAWTAVVGSMAAAFVAQGLAPGWFPAPEVLLAPAAVGLSLAIALGMVAFEVDLPDYHFGLRQIASLAAGVALVLGIVPALGAAVSGDWGLPASDFSSTLSNLGAKDAQHGPYRLLWLGEAAVVPGAPWRLLAPTIGHLGRAGALAYTTADDGTGDVTDLLPGPDSGATSKLAQTLRIAASGSTTRLGALLAPMGIRYIVVPLANAPQPYNTGPTSHPTELLSMLDDQLDLANVDVTGGVAVYRNAAWGPARAQLPAGTSFPPGGPGIADRTVPELAGAPTALPDTSSFASYSGSLAQPTMVYLSAGTSRWNLEVGGRRVSATRVLGWANAFDAPAGSSATLRYDTPSSRWLWLGGQVLAWLLLLGAMFRTRVRAQSQRDLEVIEAEGELA